jgi:hypothetical protein
MIYIEFTMDLHSYDTERHNTTHHDRNRMGIIEDSVDPKSDGMGLSP